MCGPMILLFRCIFGLSSDYLPQNIPFSHLKMIYNGINLKEGRAAGRSGMNESAVQNSSQKTYWVYMLRCADGSLYCGITCDRERRLSQHNAGTASKCTRSRRPVEMVWSREIGSKSDALKEEARIKALTRAEKIELISS